MIDAKYLGLTANQLAVTASKLEAENKKLREQLKASDDGRERQANNLIDKCHKIARLRGENAKLTQLVRQMYPRAKANLQLGVMLGCNDTLSYDWALQMTELGIEVPS